VCGHVTNRRFGGNLHSPIEPLQPEGRTHLFYYCAGEGKHALAEVLLEVSGTEEYISVTLAYHISFDIGDDACEQGWGSAAAELARQDEDDEDGHSITIRTFKDLGLIGRRDKSLSSTERMTKPGQYVTFDDLRLEALDQRDQQQRAIFVVLDDDKRLRIRKKCERFLREDLPVEQKAADPIFQSVQDSTGLGSPASGHGDTPPPPQPLSPPVSSPPPPLEPLANPGSWWARQRPPYLAPHNDLVFVLKVRLHLLRQSHVTKPVARTGAFAEGLTQERCPRPCNAQLPGPARAAGGVQRRMPGARYPSVADLICVSCSARKTTKLYACPSRSDASRGLPQGGNRKDHR
jgi:hypothetical protein